MMTNDYEMKSKKRLKCFGITENTVKLLKNDLKSEQKLLNTNISKMKMNHLDSYANKI